MQNQQSNEKRQTRSLTADLLIAIIVLSVVVLIPITSSLVTSNQEQSRAEQFASLNQLSDELSQAVSFQAIERGSGNTMIASAGVPSSAIVDINLLNRNRGDTRVQASIDIALSLKDTLNDPDFNNAIDAWQDAYKNLVDARPRIQNKSITSAEWLRLANKNIDSEKALIAVAFAPRSDEEKTIFYNSIVRSAATDIIHYLGQQRAVYGATLSSKAPISPANEARLSVLGARVSAAVGQLSEIQDRETTPVELADEIRAFQARFNGSFKIFVEEIRSQSEAGFAAAALGNVDEAQDSAAVLSLDSATEPINKEVYDKTPAEWFGEAGATIQLASNISLLSGQQARSSALAQQVEAKQTFGWTVAQAVAIIIVLIVVYFWFKNSIISKISIITETSQKVASGDLGVRVTFDSGNEIGVLADNFNQMVEGLIDAERVSVERREIAEAQSEELQAGIQNLLMATSEGSDGDLTIRAPVTEGTLGNVADAFNLMAEELGFAISEIKNVAEDVASQTKEINNATEQMKNGASKQTGEISSASSSVETMAANIQSVASRATEAADTAKKTLELAEQGQAAVDDVTLGMERIRSAVQDGARKIKQLGESTMEISSIIGTIRDISEQTNMLALNAAIEAARAGEHGRGFTVVASEVRKLAERASHATSEIEDLISGIQAETNQSVETMELQITNVENETAVVGRAGESLKSIALSSMDSAELISGISLSAKEQVEGANNVVAIMKLVSEISEEAKATADANQQSTELLDSQAGKLLETTGRFKT